MVRTQHFHCRGPEFNPWSSGNYDPTSHVVQQKKRKEKKKNQKMNMVIVLNFIGFL